MNKDQKTLAPGFLIAVPQMGDPNFHRSVILMVDHNESGSMGLVINRAAPLTLGDLAKGQSMGIAEDRKHDSVFLGGPVETHRGFVLHDDPEQTEKHEVLDGLYLSVTLDALVPLLKNPARRLRFYLGYSGWGPKQLEREISAGAWLFTEAKARLALEGNPDDLWDATLREMGVDPAMLVPGGGVQ